MSELKIAMLVRQFSPHGGLELYAHKVVEGLLARGVRVTVVCQENTSELQHENLSFKRIATNNSKSKRARLLTLFKNASEAISELTGIDLVHSQHCPTNSADVVTFHNHTTKRLNEVGLWWEQNVNELKRRFVPAYKLRDQQDETLLRHASCLIFPAEVMKEDYYSAFPFLNGPPPKPYVVAHPGSSMVKTDHCAVEASTTTSQSRLSASEQARGPNASTTSIELEAEPAPGYACDKVFRFLFVGRGFRKKGLDILLNACRILKTKTQQEFELLIAGLSERTADTLRLKLLGLQNVNYLGFQKDMESVYAKAKCIILPSRVEPFGMAPVQAMQRGLVPIVSRVSGVAEVLTHEHDALLLSDQLNAEELAALMQRLMQDQKLHEQLSTNALATAEKVSWDDTVTQTWKAYEIALSLKNSSKSTLTK